MQKVAMITGGAQGIGRATAIQFAWAGYAVSIADIDKDAGVEIIQYIRKLGGNALFVRTDISSPEQVEKWFRLTTEELGRVDVLINNAGISRNGPMTELSLDDFDRVMRVNVYGAFHCSQLAARLMRKQGTGGNIIHIASTRALMSEPNTEAYSASKGALLSLTHAMAVSLGHYGIRVNAISPGWIETRDWQYSKRAVPPVHSERDRLQHPVGRVGVPDDIARACLFLCSDQAGFITGQNLVIDGGMTIKMIYED